MVFADAVERHRRVPIEEDDVRRAAQEAGLEVVDSFSGSNYGLYGSHNSRRFYVLRLPTA